MQHGDAAELAAECIAMPYHDSRDPASFTAKRAMQDNIHIASDTTHVDSKFTEDFTNDSASRQIEE